MIRSPARLAAVRFSAVFSGMRHIDHPARSWLARWFTHWSTSWTANRSRLADGRLALDSPLLLVACALGALLLASCHRSGAEKKEAMQSPASARSAVSQEPPGPLLPKANAARKPDPSRACADGIDNDGDGRIDWQEDLGCFGPSDDDERAEPRAREDGFTTFDIPKDTRVVYVSSSGDDGSRGADPASPVRSLERATRLIQEAGHGFILLKRGDTLTTPGLGEFLSGRDAQHPVVIASYGNSLARPRVISDSFFIDHNGHSGSHLVITGIELLPAQENQEPAGFRLVGSGDDILIEDCHLKYGTVVAQSYNGVYRNFQFRKNFVEQAYRKGTCDRSSRFRVSGMFSAAVVDMLLEGNVFDHNGWSEDHQDACGTMYNHNLYLNARSLVIKDNILSRSSSMGLKLSANDEGEVQDVTVTDNFFYEGEIGVSVGGNGQVPRRFQDVRIENNVFYAMGTLSGTGPTGRQLAWGIEVKDNLRSVIRGNFFTAFANVPNSYGVSLGGGNEEDVIVTENVFDRISGTALLVDANDTFARASIHKNRIVLKDGSCALDQRGPQDQILYAKNAVIDARLGHLFCTGGVAKDAADPVVQGFTSTDQPSGTTRTFLQYARSQGYESVEVYLKAALAQSRLESSPALTAQSINAYLRK